MNTDEARRALADLCDREWHVQDIVGRPILDGAPARFRIEADGRLSGRTGCNLFTCFVHIDGASIRFEDITTTRSVCPPAIMDQERRLVHALEAANRFTVDAVGALHLQGQYEPFLLRAATRGSGS